MRYGVMAASIAMAAGVARAQPQTGEIRWQASLDGFQWREGWFSLSPGDAYKLRAVVSWTDGATPSVGFARATFEQINFAGAGSDDVFGGASGVGGVPTYVKRLQPFAESWSLQAGTGTSAGGLKIDNDAAGARTNLGQLPKILPGPTPNPDFSSVNPLVVLEMNAVAGPIAKIITVSGDWTRLGAPASDQFLVYTTETGTSQKPLQEAQQFSIVIDSLTPAPGAGVVLGLAGVMAGARRRRGA